MEIEKMIAKKEDLINTYVKTDSEELVHLYLKKCKEFGFTWFSGKDINSSKANGSAVGLNEDVKLSVTNGSLDYFNDKNCRELSLLDLKPRTKTEFVKCEYSREWKAVRHYNEVGELFVVDCNGNYTNVNDISGAWYEVVCKNYKELYIKVETEIDERQEFIDTACAINEKAHGERRQYLVESMYDSGKFKLVE